MRRWPWNGPWKPEGLAEQTISHPVGHQVPQVHGHNFLRYIRKGKVKFGDRHSGMRRDVLKKSGIRSGDLAKPFTVGASPRNQPGTEGVEPVAVKGPWKN